MVVNTFIRQRRQGYHQETIIQGRQYIYQAVPQGPPPRKQSDKVVKTYINHRSGSAVRATELRSNRVVKTSTNHRSDSAVRATELRTNRVVKTSINYRSDSAVRATYLRSNRVV